MDGRIFYLREQMLENLKLKWTVEEMAKVVNISESHLHQLFKKEMQTTPIAFLLGVRLIRSCELLETTFDTIYQIRNKVGIRDESHFTRDFKNGYGVTPTQYRKQYWDKIQDEKLPCQE